MSPSGILLKNFAGFAPRIWFPRFITPDELSDHRSSHCGNCNLNEWYFTRPKRQREATGRNRSRRDTIEKLRNIYYHRRLRLISVRKPDDAIPLAGRFDCTPEP